MDEQIIFRRVFFFLYILLGASHSLKLSLKAYMEEPFSYVTWEVCNFFLEKSQCIR